MKVIRIQDLINPHFRELWTTDKPYVIAKGGRGSFKSSTISLKLVMMMKQVIQRGGVGNVAIIRENATNLRSSVYGQIEWALNMLDMTDEFTFQVSPMRIYHRRTGSSFYFYGADKPERLKSNTIGNVIALWYEEAANFKSSEVFDQVNPTFIRQRSKSVSQVKVFYSFNPPRNPFEWINEWVDSMRGNKDFLIDTSTYLDDELGINSEQTLNLIETYKQNDYEYYRYLYLGEPVGLGNNVYNINLFKWVDTVPDDDDILEIAYAIDSGHQVSATTCLAFGISKKQDVYLLDTYYYSPANKVVKKAPSVLDVEIDEFMRSIEEQYPYAEIIKKTIDSAEGALRNQYFKDFNEYLHPVKKLDNKDMIDNVQDLLAQGRFFMLNIQRNQIFYEEHRKYQWDPDTIETGRDPKVIKINDHTVDAFKYFALDNRIELGLIY